MKNNATTTCTINQQYPKQAIKHGSFSDSCSQTSTRGLLSKSDADQNMKLNLCACTPLRQSATKLIN